MDSVRPVCWLKRMSRVNAPRIPPIMECGVEGNASSYEYRCSSALSGIVLNCLLMVEQTT